MQAPHGAPEIEIKLRLASAGDGLKKLAAAGFVEQSARCLERNTIYDDERQGLRRRGELVRVRHYGEQVVLTFKGRGGEVAGSVAGSLHKHRPEMETVVAHEAPLVAVLHAAGLRPVLRYEKYRTVFVRDGEPGLALLDETPIGPFLELEGPPEWIDRCAAAMGFHVADYLTQSYLSLNQEDCLRRGVAVSDMVFSKEWDDDNGGRGEQAHCDGN
ncbi:MAG: class IV adenylate cyclase [Acidobacteria bacterium]|nr:class IV adenylate cyclase [Acidobacteriota bacterium]